MAREARNFIPGTEIQIVQEPKLGSIQFVVADFDGTLSLIRDGWQDVMVPQHVEALLDTPHEQQRVEELGEAPIQQELESLAREYIDRLTGKQTIYQMIELARQVKERGGNPSDPQEYKDIYHARLLKQIEYRRQGLEAGTYAPTDWILARGELLMQAFVDRGCVCYLASGTDEEFVLEEAHLLGFGEIFGERIYGAIRDYQSYSKEMVIRRILEEGNLQGEQLLVMGDGVVEVGLGREVGAVVIGVNSIEKNRYGMNANKRDRLIEAGAQLVVPDFRDYRALIDYLFEPQESALSKLE